MRRKDEVDILKKKQTQKEQFFQLSFDAQISILLPYLKKMSSTIQTKFLLALKLVIEQQTVNEQIKAYIHKMLSIKDYKKIDITKNTYFLEIYCRFLKLNNLKVYFSNIAKKSSTIQMSQDYTNNKQNLTKQTQPFEPNIQRQGEKLQPIVQVINPNYQNLVKLYKTFTDVHINMEYKTKELNQNYTFYSQPRFVSKLLQVHDFESSFSEKGNIVMMSFEGNKIVGKRGFAFSNGQCIYWWEKNYKDYKDVFPQLVQDKDKEDKQKNKKKQGEREESWNPRINQSFKLAYKLVGHHGKITSLSLSDDQYYLISAGTDKIIKLWCLRQKCLLAQYRGHNKVIWSVSFSKSGYYFLSGSADKSMKLWSTDDSIAQRVYLGHQEDVIKVDFLKNPDLVASASEDKTVRIWNTLNTQCINIIALNHSAVNFKSSQTGRFFVICDSSGGISIYDLLKGQLLNNFKISQKFESDSGTVKYLKIHDMCFSLDEKQFACVSSRYIVIYSLDKICEKQSKSIFIEAGKDSSQKRVTNKQVIYTGRDSNIVYCDYIDKGVLLVASTSIKKY